MIANINPYNEVEFLKDRVISFELDDDHINDNLSEGTMRILLKI